MAAYRSSEIYGSLGAFIFSIRQSAPDAMHLGTYWSLASAVKGFITMNIIDGYILLLSLTINENNAATENLPSSKMFIGMNLGYIKLEDHIERVISYWRIILKK